MKRKRLYVLFLLAMLTPVAIVVTLVLMTWYIPTHVRVDLTVNRAVFTIGSESTPILDLVRFQSVTIEDFDRIELNPEQLEVADPVQYEIAQDRYPESAWNPIPVIPPVVITCEDERLQPAITLESVKAGPTAVGTLDEIYANRGSEVTVELGEVQTMVLTLKVKKHQASTTLSVYEPFQLTGEYVRFSGIESLPYQSDSLTCRTRLPDHSPFIRITTGKQRSLILTVTILPENSMELFSSAGIPVTSLDFSRLDKIGNRVTALVERGEITYPDYQGYPNITKVSFEPPDFIELNHLERFTIRKIFLDREHKGIRFILEGIAGHVKTGSQEFEKDHRLNLFNSLSKNHKLVALYGVIGWVISITVWGYTLYKGLKRD